MTKFYNSEILESLMEVLMVQAKTKLFEKINELRPEQQEFFWRLHQSKEVIENFTICRQSISKIDWMLYQVENTLKKNVDR